MVVLRGFLNVPTSPGIGNEEWSFVRVKLDRIRERKKSVPEKVVVNEEWSLVRGSF